MTTTPEPPTGPTSPEPLSWPSLDLRGRRVLGVLVEKAKTTPEAYPLSVNALVTGSNQKSNRDPILNLSDEDVEDTLAALQKRGYVQKVIGGRVERWRHALYEGWRVNKVELAVLAELLLRGPQTEGELRTRASRMESIDDLEALRLILKSLAGRNLVVYLSPEGRRGAMVAHGFHAPGELARLRSSPPAELERVSEVPGRPATPASDTLAPLESALAECRAEMETMRAELAQVREQVVGLAEQLHSLRRELGVEDRPA